MDDLRPFDQEVLHGSIKFPTSGKESSPLLRQHVATAARVLMDGYFHDLALRLGGQRNAQYVSDEDRQTIDFFQVVLGRTADGEIRLAMQRHNIPHGIVLAITQYLIDNKDPSMPDKPVRKHTRTFVRVRERK